MGIIEIVVDAILESKWLIALTSGLIGVTGGLIGTLISNHALAKRQNDEFKSRDKENQKEFQRKLVFERAKVYSMINKSTLKLMHLRSPMAHNQIVMEETLDKLEKQIEEFEKEIMPYTFILPAEVQEFFGSIIWPEFRICRDGHDKFRTVVDYFDLVNEIAERINTFMTKEIVSAEETLFNHAAINK